MGWLGKVVGGLLGFAAGGPIGALVGATVGHGVDRGANELAQRLRLAPGSRERVQSAFFTATFATMGHLAKADGRVSEAEIALAESVMTRMQLAPPARKTAIALFRQGKSPDFDLGAVIDAFRTECQDQRLLVQMFLEIQLQAAFVDGEPTPAQRMVLERVRAGLHVSELVFRQIETFVRLQRQFTGAAGARSGAGAGAGYRSSARRQEPARPTLAQAYSLLGVSPKDTDATVTRAYRRLLSQNHPDKLVAKGLPEEMMKLAAQKTHEIRRAYEMIQQARAA